MSDRIVGRVKKAYTVSSIFYPYFSTAEYLSVFFTDESIILARYMYFGNMIEAGLVSAFGKEKKKLHRPFISKHEILSRAKHASELHKNHIKGINLKMQLTDVALVIEFPSTKGMFRDKRNYLRIEFSKKEYTNVDFILSKYFPDKYVKQSCSTHNTGGNFRK